jgi:predicted nucleic acid-binding protein
LVTISYLDTSAAMKLVLDEPQSAALTAELADRDDRRLVSSWLLHAEMHCAAGRHPEDVDLEAVRTVLDSVNLIDLTRGDLLAAGAHAPLRSNDAVHLAVALRVGADEIVTYDGEVIARATAAGLPVLSPEATSHP